jgi:hypothetical protein
MGDLMFDTEKIQDMTDDLYRADASIRKSLTLPGEMTNPARVAKDLARLALQATSAAQAIMILMANERDRELTTAALHKQIESGDNG